MAISFLTGTPGAGKTYSAVELCILPALEQGRPIWTNLILREELILKDYPLASLVRMNPTDRDTWSQIPGGSLVVIDEVGNIWPSGTKASQTAEEAREFIAMHRHKVGPVQGRMLSCEVVLISQGSTDVAAWVRTRIDKTYFLQKLDKVGMERKYRLDVYNGYQTTGRERKKDHIRGYIAEYREKVYRYYESHTKAGEEIEGVSVQELQVDQQNIFQSWTMRLAAVGILVAIFAVITAVTKFQDWITPEEQKHHQQETPQPVALVAQPVKGQQEKELKTQTQQREDAIHDRVTELLDQRRTEAQAHARARQWKLTGWAEIAGAYNIILRRGKERRRLSGVPCNLTHGELQCQVDGLMVSRATGTLVDTWSMVDP